MKRLNFLDENFQFDDENGNAKEERGLFTPEKNDQNNFYNHEIECPRTDSKKICVFKYQSLHSRSKISNSVVEDNCCEDSLMSSKRNSIRQPVKNTKYSDSLKTSLNSIQIKPKLKSKATDSLASDCIKCQPNGEIYSPNKRKTLMSVTHKNFQKSIEKSLDYTEQLETEDKLEIIDLKFDDSHQIPMEDPNQIKIINSLRKKETVKRKYEGFAYGDFCYETQNSSGFDKAKFDLFADPKMLPQIKLKPIKLQPIQFKPKMPLVVDVEIKKEDIIPDIEIVESTPSKYSEDIGLRDPIDSQSIHSENDLTRYVVAVETTNELESPAEIEEMRNKEETFFDRISQESSDSENLKMPLGQPFRCNSMNRKHKVVDSIKLIECKREDIINQKSARRDIKTPNKITKNTYNNNVEPKMLTPCIRISAKVKCHRVTKSYGCSQTPSKGEMCVPRNLNDSPQNKQKPNRTSMILNVVNNFGKFSCPNVLSSISNDKKSNESPQLKMDRTRSPAVKRTTTIKGMGKFCKITNKRLISIAISNYLLAGDIWKNDREEALQYLEMSSNGHFLIMLKLINGKYKFNGIYILENNELINKIYSIQKSPNCVVPKMVDKFLRYDPIDAEFKEIVGMREFHDLTDAIILKANFERTAGFNFEEQKEFIVPTKSYKLS